MQFSAYGRAWGRLMAAGNATRPAPKALASKQDQSRGASSGTALGTALGGLAVLAVGSGGQPPATVNTDPARQSVSQRRQCPGLR
jgi:hypothetical protein